MFLASNIIVLATTHFSPGVAFHVPEILGKRFLLHNSLSAEAEWSQASRCDYSHRLPFTLCSEVILHLEYGISSSYREICLDNE